MPSKVLAEGRVDNAVEQMVKVELKAMLKIWDSPESKATQHAEPPWLPAHQKSAERTALPIAEVYNAVLSLANW